MNRHIPLALATAAVIVTLVLCTQSINQQIRRYAGSDNTDVLLDILSALDGTTPTPSRNLLEGYRKPLTPEEQEALRKFNQSYMLP